MAVAAVLIIAEASWAPDRAEAQTRDLVACASGSTLVAALRAVAGADPAAAQSPASLARQDYTVRRTASEVGVTTSSSQKDGTVTAPVGNSSRTCAYVPSATRKLHVETGATLPGANLASLAAVLAYREAHPWPLGPAHADAPDTTIMMQSRGGHLFVSIIDFKTLQTGGGCSAEEYYRVDLPDFVVRPFDGCIEGHQHPVGLPYLPQLPG